MGILNKNHNHLMLALEIFEIDVDELDKSYEKIKESINQILIELIKNNCKYNRELLKRAMNLIYSVIIPFADEASAGYITGLLVENLFCTCYDYMINIGRVL